MRPDGGIALSYFEFSGGDFGDVMLHTNFDPNSGLLESAFDTFTVRSLDDAAVNTSCIILADGRAAIAYGSRSQIAYSTPIRAAASRPPTWLFLVSPMPR